MNAAERSQNSEPLVAGTSRDPATRILERSEKEPASVVAMGSHGRTGFSRWVYGSVSEKVLQASKVPVLIARHTPS